MNDYKALSNKRLVRLCIDKDGLAWFEFVRRFKRLVSYAIEERLKRWGYLYQYSDVEDIRQEVFLSIWEKDLLKSLKHPEKIVSWLAILSANRAVNFFKKKSQSPPQAISLFKEKMTLELADTQNPGPLENLIFEDSFKNIIAIIKRLSSREKNILRLYLLYKKSQAEIAKLLKMPVGSVYSIVKRAKMKIKEGLRK